MNNKESEIHITYKCPYNCVFCSVNKRKQTEPTTNEIKKNIKLSKKFTKLVFSGGEPLLRKDLIEIVGFAKKYQKNISIETNLSKLNQEEIDELITSGLSEIKISIHSNKSSLYKGITNSRSFRRVLQNLKLLKNYKGKIKVTTNTVITKYNYRHLNEIIKFIEDKIPFISEIRISYPRFYPINNRKEYSKKYLVPLESIKKFIKDIKGKKVVFENIPLCILNDNRAKKINWNIKLIKHAKIIKGLEGRVYPPKCDKCKKKRECQGLHKYYTLYFRDDFVKPFT